MRDFKRLSVWQKSHQLVLDVYAQSQPFPSEERFGITAQLRRSVASIPANIAEGCGRTSEADLRKFLTIAAGSSSETEYHLLLARDLGYLEEAVHRKLTQAVSEVRRMLYAFLCKLTAEG